ncbi:MAG TPA: pectin degradation protein [Sporomusaceae bacterium]|jgi:quercetin dioxygenase-like cupin family protein|uniref:cupin domain-containing protein n=1 Tax=Anaerospora sp. TaxID=1960278 RepID=UPI000EE31E60|nr:cupin domain-containing protein [Anaerospora sp.]HAK74917.1 pectin degradation protein [Sporomusaceae bacterium]
MILAKENAMIKQLNEKCSRSILVYSDAIMLVEFRFKKGGVGEAHKHADHEQVGYIAKGSFELTVGDEKRIVCAGDSYYAARNVLHGVVALEDDSVIIDTFTPKRDDFLL